MILLFFMVFLSVPLLSLFSLPPNAGLATFHAKRESDVTRSLKSSIVSPEILCREVGIGPNPPQR